MSTILWEPSPERIAATHLQRFAQTTPVGTAEDYHALWSWSTEDLEGFWVRVWDDAGVVASRPYDEVLVDPRMPGARWFTGARLSFPENLLRRRDDGVALIGAGEERPIERVTWRELARRVGAVQRGLRALGVGEGDRVAGLVPNTVDTAVAMLAATSLGAVWSSCSPEFGPLGIVDRFGQIAPKVLITADGYRYNGTVYPLQDKVQAVCRDLPDLRHLVVMEVVGASLTVDGAPTVRWEDLDDGGDTDPQFAQPPADHPLYIMYSSGTTGPPKSIVHGTGGTLLKHLCEHRLHTDLHPDDVVFWFTTCGWMMWNWLVSALASGTTVVCYDGSPSHPDLGVLWRLAEETSITHFGTSPKFLAANANAGIQPGKIADLSRVRAVLSTGAPLLAEQFEWVYEAVKTDVQLASISGGTDLIGCFAAGVPTLPVRRGELQGRVLGMAVEAWDEHGRPVIGQKGELVCTKPFPSMPLGFWSDPDGTRYRAAYFEANPGVWTHGDLIEITPHGGVIIYGRSDTTLNPGGVRIGTAEIYRAVETMPEIADAVVVGRPVDGDVEVVLCVTLAPGVRLDDGLAQRMRQRIREQTSPRHVPKHVFAVPEIPYTLSGKKVEKAVQQTILGQPVANRDALANPEALDAFARLPLGR